MLLVSMGRQKFLAHLHCNSPPTVMPLIMAMVPCIDWIAGGFDARTNLTLQATLRHHHRPPDHVSCKSHINVKEMWAADAAALSWGPLWQDSSVVITAVRAALNLGRSKSPEIMFFLRRLLWLATEHNFQFSSVYIRSRDNTIAAALSCLDAGDRVGRLRQADTGWTMCCTHIFDPAPPCASRACGPDEREEPLPEPLVCPKLSGHQGGAGEEVPGVCGGVRGNTLATTMPVPTGGPIRHLAGQVPEVHIVTTF